MKVALTLAGTIGFWSLAYFCAWVYPQVAPTEGMGVLLFFTGAIMFLLSVGCLGHLVYWRIRSLKREMA